MVKVNYQTAIFSPLTPKIFVDECIDEPKVVKKNPDDVFIRNFLSISSHVIPNCDSVQDNEAVIKSYVVDLSGNKRTRRDLPVIFFDQDTEFDNNNLTNLNSVTINIDPLLNNKVSNKDYIDNNLVFSSTVSKKEHNVSMKLRRLISIPLRLTEIQLWTISLLKERRLKISN